MHRGRQASRKCATQLVQLRDKPHPPETGLTLIELLVTVVIIGLTFVIILGGISTAILGSDVQHRQATADAVLRSAADKVRSEGDPLVRYRGCATSYTLPGLDPAGYVRSVATVVGYWDGADFKNPEAYSCSTTTPTPAGSNPDRGLQLLELSVTAEGRSVVETMQLVKRKP